MSQACRKLIACDKVVPCKSAFTNHLAVKPADSLEQHAYVLREFNFYQMKELHFFI